MLLRSLLPHPASLLLSWFLLRPTDPSQHCTAELQMSFLRARITIGRPVLPVPATPGSTIHVRGATALETATGPAQTRMSCFSTPCLGYHARTDGPLKKFSPCMIVRHGATERPLCCQSAILQQGRLDCGKGAGAFSCATPRYGRPHDQGKWRRHTYFFSFIRQPHG
jgi:hypothetical protein